MKIKSMIFPALGLLALSLPVSGEVPNLPTVNILGKEYYYHEVQKGESVYGVSRQYNWDLEKLRKLNPHVAKDMKKGSKLYYPVEVTDEADIVSSDFEPEEEPEVTPITHVVKRGETVYSIARQYGIPLDDIYSSNPDAKYGIKAGEELVLVQNPDRKGTRFIFYQIKPGDTLYSLAKSHHISVESILRDNPGISENNFRAGETIRLSNDESSKVKTAVIEEERIASIDSYKAKKNDSWESISRKTGVDAETLREANTAIREPEKNSVIRVPVVETVKVEKEVTPQDPREQTSEGIRELYDSIHRIDSDVRILEEVNVALLLDEPSSKKDIEFTRGFLLALDGMDETPFKVNLKVIDGSGSTMAVTDALDEFGPHILIATADKAFPAFLADYGETNHLEVVNAFDVKNELYEENPSMIQLLTPSALFNEEIADMVAADYGNREVIVVGPEDDGDSVFELLKGKFEGKELKPITVATLSETSLDDAKSYLIYATSQKRDDVFALLNVVRDIRERCPVADITIMGRPNWVTLTDLFQNNYHEAEIVVPARCWVDVENGSGKLFADKFEDMFGQEPLKSFPNFAASGYDVANYFIRTTAENGGDYNRQTTRGNGIQNDFNLERTSNWGGFLNRNAYLLRFKPSGNIEKITVR